VTFSPFPSVQLRRLPLKPCTLREPSQADRGHERHLGQVDHHRAGWSCLRPRDGELADEARRSEDVQFAGDMDDYSRAIRSALHP
jgi:hypothetical protein